MTHTTHSPPRGLMKKLAIGASIIASFLLAGNSANAVTTAGHILENSVSVAYKDSGGNVMTAATDTIQVTVNLVETAPYLSAPGDATTAIGSTEYYKYRVTSKANGEDNYTITQDGGTITQNGGTAGTWAANALYEDDGTGSDNSGTGSAPNTGATVTNYDLGAAIAIGPTTLTNGTTTVVTVTADNSSDSEVNGFIIGDFIEIIDSGTNLSLGVVEVTAINDTNGGTANATSTITLENDTGGDISLTKGDMLGETKIFWLAATPTAGDGGEFQDTVTTATVTGSAPTVETTDTTRNTIVGVANLVVTKFVRNVTTANAGASQDTGDGTTVTSINGATFYSSDDIAGSPAETLEYAIVIENTGASNATDVIVTDTLATYTTFLGGMQSCATQTITDPIAIASCSGTFTDTDDGDNGEHNSGTVYGFVGDTPNPTSGGSFGDGTGGSIAAGELAVFIYQVTID